MQRHGFATGQTLGSDAMVGGFALGFLVPDAVSGRPRRCDPVLTPIRVPPDESHNQRRYSYVAGQPSLVTKSHMHEDKEPFGPAWRDFWAAKTRNCYGFTVFSRLLQLLDVTD